jgi:hypothetical protein
MTKMVRKGTKMTKKQAMIDAGYSESYATSGGHKKKKSWNQLLEESLPDEFLVKKHRELLLSKELAYFIFPKSMDDEEIEEKMVEAGVRMIVIQHSDKGKMAFYARKNTRAIKDGLDLAYKAKGKNAPEKFEVEQTGLRSLSDAELAEIIKKQTDRFKKRD